MDSPFTGHLYTNYIPSIHEVNQIQQLLRIPYGDELSSLDAEIHRLQQQLYELQRRREILANDVDAHKALISLIRRLPQEVLQEIFIACLPEDRNPCMSASDAPVLLTRICTPDPVERKIIQREAVVKEWLARSGQCLLSISLYQAFQTVSYPAFHRDLFQLSEHLHITFFQDVLLPHSRRWYDMKCFATLNMLHLVRNIPASDTPLLKKLHLSCGTVKQATAQHNIWKDSRILQTPHLEAVTLSLPYHPIRLFDVKLLERWPNLTDLGLRIDDNNSDESPPQIIYEMLRSCPLLESLRLYIETLPFDGIPSPKSEKVYLQRLQTLGIVVTNGKFGYLWPLFHAIDAPLLQHFELDYIQPWNEGLNVMPADAIYIVLRDFLTTFGSNLLTWRLRPIPGLQSSQFLDLLKLTPCLRELSITSEQPQPLTEWYYPNIFFRPYDMVDDKLIYGLTPSANETICPQLEIFKCISGIDTTISEAAVVEFVRARRQLVPTPIARPIRHLEVTLAHASDDGSSFKLPPYNEEGVTGGVVYKRKVARGRYSPFIGFPFSPVEISREVGFQTDIPDFI
ncbi:hypothetical protein BDQ17DRAFT_1342347 [Cyathus striatus]|nr:hypothetical protein BDQ17DRAFT_1342347 [Cyathus striatus]